LDLPTSTTLLKCPIKFSLRDVKIPGYLDRAEVLLNKVGSRVDLSASHLWAAPLSLELTRLLGQAINEQLGQSELLPYPLRQNERPEWLFHMEISRVDLDMRELSIQLSFYASSLKSPIESEAPSYRSSITSKVPLPIIETSNGNLANRFSRSLGQAINLGVKEILMGGEASLCKPREK
jgi:ABC-type transport auxiliary lipoprotein component